MVSQIRTPSNSRPPLRQRWRRGFPLNQMSTLSEARQVINRHNDTCAISPRSGEEAFIADLVVVTNVSPIKTGSLK